ncbi:MAG: hypothetical protein M3Y25_04380, partial [Thermoproteota archaeon]|nr:hypothetical protein [Thermoproteota archaeon]
MSLESQYFAVLINNKEKTNTAADAADAADERVSNLENDSLNLDNKEGIKEKGDYEELELEEDDEELELEEDDEDEDEDDEEDEDED